MEDPAATTANVTGPTVPSPTTQWPEKYELAIKRFISEVPIIDEILKTFNVQYQNWKNVTLQGDSTYIFGGFLRWVVERDGENITPEELLEYGSDVDIAIVDHEDCCDKLMKIFRKIIAYGRIEYAGMTYGSKSLSQVNFDPADDKYPPYGNYMIYLPYTDRTEGANTEGTNTEGTNTEGTNTEGTNTEGTNTGGTKDGKGGINRKPTRWLKIDIIYSADHRIVTDFTANALRYPKKIGAGLFKCALADIKNRNIMPMQADMVGAKDAFRAIKMMRRGYKFLDNILPMMYVEEQREEIVRRRAQNAQRGLVGVALLNTNVPSLKRSGRIITTAHTPTPIDCDYLETLPEFQEMKLMRTDNVLRADDDSEYHEVLRTTLHEVRVYKLAHIYVRTDTANTNSTVSTSTRCYHVCTELIIPAGTKYIGPRHNYLRTHYRFERALLGRVFAYPYIDIRDKVIASGAKLVSNYDIRFNYNTEGEIVPKVDGRIVPLAVGQLHGLWAMLSLSQAWRYNSYCDESSTVLTEDIIEKVLATAL